MHYLSTRGTSEPVSVARAINQGLAPGGGLFVPETVPTVGLPASGLSYADLAMQVLRPLLTDFSEEQLRVSIGKAYNDRTFDARGVVELATLGPGRWVLELWHGPTAAFKDVALQIMPHFMSAAKAAEGDRRHTVILVATSGDTGKAALEGFKDCDGISIVVFYPCGGVSEIQRLQMATTDGSNTHVVAVNGNFDDCQTAVKGIFEDAALARNLDEQGLSLSSANSINWGRLCPQIVYYFRAYQSLVDTGATVQGRPVDFCVPTGNFGNILAGYYALRMGLPVRRLVCASNRNNVLADFFSTGSYNRNRPFHRTMSPSMDILISSNLERFLFEVAGHDAGRIESWYADLARTGRFTVDSKTKAAMDHVITPGWVDEERVLKTIGRVYKETGYVLDTHTAVAAAVCEDVCRDDTPVVIAATASPYKFSPDVLRAVSGRSSEDEFECIDRLHQLSGLAVHRAVSGLREKQVRHDRVIEIRDMLAVVRDITSSLR